MTSQMHTDACPFIPSRDSPETATARLVAHALLRAASALMPTLGSIRQRLVSRKSRHGTVRACATSHSRAPVSDTLERPGGAFPRCKGAVPRSGGTLPLAYARGSVTAGEPPKTPGAMTLGAGRKPGGKAEALAPRGPRVFIPVLARKGVEMSLDTARRSACATLFPITCADAT